MKNLIIQYNSYVFGSEEPFTPKMEGVIDLHNHIFFYAVLVLVVVCLKFFFYRVSSNGYFICDLKRDHTYYFKFSFIHFFYTGDFNDDLRFFIYFLAVSIYIVVFVYKYKNEIYSKLFNLNYKDWFKSPYKPSHNFKNLEFREKREFVTNSGSGPVSLPGGSVDKPKVINIINESYCCRKSNYKFSIENNELILLFSDNSNYFVYKNSFLDKIELIVHSDFYSVIDFDDVNFFFRLFDSEFQNFFFFFVFYGLYFYIFC